jgi:hypothetical protein
MFKVSPSHCYQNKCRQQHDPKGQPNLNAWPFKWGFANLNYNTQESIEFH